ncbi:MAG: prepilin peptidase [Candidatus Goldbacteria bacterium]|nr:prepilin peptidase [Candidatus Goldiibacteriota bacterium]
MFGSFFNVCIYRIPKNLSIFFPFSFCPVCKRKLKWYHNIPVFSFLFLKGKCYYCNKKISIKYPLIELLTALLFVTFFLKFGLEKIYFFYIIITGYLIVLSMIDIETKQISDIIILLLIITGIIFCIIEINKINIFEGIISFITAGFIIFLLNFFSNEKIGEGDIKLMAGLALPAGILFTLKIIFFSFILGGIFSLLLLISGRYRKNKSIAFVPFIFLSFILVSLIS